MARRWAWWLSLGILLVVLLAFGTRRLLREIPGLLAKAEDTIREEANTLGLRVAFRNVRFHPLHLRVSLEDLDVRDRESGVSLARAERVDLSLSPRRILTGLSPVSRVRVWKFVVRAGEAGRPLWERIRAAGTGNGEGRSFPEILLLDGEVHGGRLGPLARWDAEVPEIRVRSARLLGTIVTARVRRSVARLAGRSGGVAHGTIPFDEADVEALVKGDSVRIRKLRASGPSAAVTLSGLWDGGRGTIDLRGSGRTDITRWAETGAPGGAWLRRVASRGTVSFSGRVEGPVGGPRGTATVSARNVVGPAETPVDVDISVAVSGHTVRLTSIRGDLWGGTLNGSARYDFREQKGEGALSLSDASFGKAPWKRWGGGWRPTGRGTLTLSVSGERRSVRGTVSWTNPDGFERTAAEGAPGRAAVPLSVRADCEFVPGQTLRVQGVRVALGGAWAAGAGTVRLRDRTVSFAGSVSLPAGRAADYGISAPLSWRTVSGVWTIAGNAEAPHVTAEARAEGLSSGRFPAVALSVKLDGNPRDVVHFAADVPAAAAKVTAVGTVTGPWSSAMPLLEATVSARQIDFSLAQRWGAALVSALGSDPARFDAYVAGISGAGTADLRISAGADRYAVSGTMSGTVRRGEIGVRELSVSGSAGKTLEGWRFGFRAGGKLGDGEFVLRGKGDGAKTELVATADGIDLGAAVSLADPKYGGRLGGRVSLAVDARTGPAGWEIKRFSASGRTVTAGTATFEEISAEGSLGPSVGRFSVASARPGVRVAADVRREPGWPVSFTVSADGIPTKMLLAAAGRGDEVAGGTWDARLQGELAAADVLAGGALRPEDFEALRLSVSAESPLFSGLSFHSVLGEGKKTGDVLAGEISTRLPDSRLAFSLSLRNPFEFRVEGPFTLGRSPEGAAAARSAGAAEVDAAANEKARFRVAGRLEVAGSLAAPAGSRGSLRVDHLAYRNGAMDLTGEGILIRLSPEGIRWGAGTLATAGNPLAVSGGMSWDGNLDIRLEGRAPAAAVRLATDVFDRLDGTVRISLRVKGPWDDPSIVGTGRLEHGTFSFRGYAQLFEEMKADAVISREKIVFDHFEGRSGAGYIDGRGELPLRFDNGQKMFFSVDFFDMRYPYPEDLRPVLQGHVDLLGPVDDLLVDGDVEIQSARYTKPVRPEQALLDFRKRLADVTARRKDSGFRMWLDLDVVADDTIHVRNNIAEADAEGEFQVAGDTSRVIVLGSFEVTKGHVDYRGNRYELTRGGLEFQDPRRNNPRLDFRAETRKGDVTVTVGVTGTLEKYEVELASDPPLSKNDIVSLLSLGVRSQNLAGAGGSVSAAEAAAIALGPYTGRMEQGIRDVIGLDKFAVEPSFSSTDKSLEPRFIVGKTFGDRFSVSLSTNVGTTTESSAVAEWKVFENMYLQGAWQGSTRTREGDLGADLKFRYRYRQFRDIFRGRD